MKKVFLGIGSNLGNRSENLKEALVKIGEHIGKIKCASSVYETEPWGFSSENKFLNMVVKVETSLTASDLLKRVLMIESLLGRLRDGSGYKSRTIDIDILLYGNQVLKENELIIPHPRLHERKFVLVPLCEIAPNKVHPLLKKTIRVLLKECTDKSKVGPQEIKTVTAPRYPQNYNSLSQK